MQPVLTVVEETKAELRRDFPAWSIIRSKPNGRWFAFRYPEFDENRRLVHHRITDLEAGTAEELRSLLRKAAKATRAKR